MHYELRNITIGYGDKVIAKNINAELHTGELVCLIGRNGTGKSTLLRTLAGFLSPLAGSAMLEGIATHTMTPQQRSRLISVVLTDRIDAQGMTVHDLVATGRSPYTGFFGRLSSEDEAVIMDSLNSVGMSDYIQRMVNTLSDGERQKVMIAKALAQQTPVILLDEPTAFLDYPSKVETLRLLRSLCEEQGKAILVSTHDLDVAMRITSQVWMMQRMDGNTNLQIGTPEELYAPIREFMNIGEI